MNQIELDMMRGMVSILNEASKAYYNGSPIMTDEQFDMRSSDLVMLEAETGVVLLNSPYCKIDVQSIIKASEAQNDRLRECQDIKDVIEFFNQKEMVAYIDIDGLDMFITYTNGRIVNIQIDSANDCVLSAICNLDIPYCIPKTADYIIKGKMVISDNPVFYATDIVQGGYNTLNGNLSELKDLGFNVIQNWNVANLNPKSFQSGINYIFEYAEEDGLPCNGIVFKLNDIEYSKMLNIMSCDFYDGVIMKRKEE